MVKWKLCLGTGLLAACCFSAGAFAAGHVEDVEAISQVYGAVAAAGDPGAKPSMDTIMAQLDADGDRVIRGTIAQDAPETQVDQLTEQMIQPGVHAYYLLYHGGSHRSTWQHAYDITPVKEWIFGQKKRS